MKGKDVTASNMQRPPSDFNGQEPNMHFLLGGTHFCFRQALSTTTRRLLIFLAAWRTLAAIGESWKRSPPTSLIRRRIKGMFAPSSECGRTLILRPGCRLLYRRFCRLLCFIRVVWWYLCAAELIPVGAANAWIVRCRGLFQDRAIWLQEVWLQEDMRICKHLYSYSKVELPRINFWCTLAASKALIWESRAHLSNPNQWFLLKSLLMLSQVSSRNLQFLFFTEQTLSCDTLRKSAEKLVQNGKGRFGP